MSNNKLYVTMTDKFMSGWGEADGKVNKLVIQCDTWMEAEIVEANALRRSEMKYVNIRTTKPRYNSKKYLTSWVDKEDGGKWYTPNSFID